MKFIFTSISIYLLCWLIACSDARAQDMKSAFGAISEADLAMEFYDKDPDASALMLLNYTEYFTRPGGRLEARVLRRIKIFNTEGFGWAAHKIKYFRGGGRPRDMAFATYNLEADKVIVTEVDAKELEAEKLDKTYSQIVVSMPRVKAGSIVDMSYTYAVDEDGLIPDWQWQLDIPVKYAEIVIDMGPGARTRSDYRLVGDLLPEKPQNRKHSFDYVMRDIEALADEPYVFSRENYRSAFLFDYRGFKSWGHVIGKLMSEVTFGGTFKFNGDLKRFFPAGNQWKNDEKSMIEIFNFVRDHFTWNDYLSIMPSEKPRKTWEHGSGNSGEINSVLLNMLRLNKINAEPVLMSTTSHGKIDKDKALIGQFNNFVVYAVVGGKGFILDATEKSRPYNQLPTYCLNDKGLVISEKNPAWVSMNMNREREVENATVEFTINNQGEVVGKIEYTFKSLAASAPRKIIFKKGIEGLRNKFSEDLEDYEMEDFKVVNANDPDKPLGVSFSFKSIDANELNADVLFVNPLLLKTFSLNPLKDESRKLPVEFFAPMVSTSLFRFKIPEGYLIEGLPEAKNYVLPGGDAGYIYSASVVDGYLEVIVRFNIKKLSFSPLEYPTLKSFFDLMLDKQNEQVVLKKQ